VSKEQWKAVRTGYQRVGQMGNWRGNESAERKGLYWAEKRACQKDKRTVDQLVEWKAGKMVVQMVVVRAAVKDAKLVEWWDNGSVEN
jgi:hypothetical protein